MPSASRTWRSASLRRISRGTTSSWSSPPRGIPPTISSPRRRRSTPRPPSGRWICSSPPASRSAWPSAPWPWRSGAFAACPSTPSRWASSPPPSTRTPASAASTRSGSAPSWTSTASSSSRASRAWTAAAMSPPWAGAAPIPAPWPWRRPSTPTSARSSQMWTGSTPRTPASCPPPASSARSPMTRCWSLPARGPRSSTTAAWSWPRSTMWTWRSSPVWSINPAPKSRRS